MTIQNILKQLIVTVRRYGWNHNKAQDKSHKTSECNKENPEIKTIAYNKNL